MLITAFKRTVDLYDLKNSPFLFHAPPTLEHVKFLFARRCSSAGSGNTGLAGLAVVAITLLSRLLPPTRWRA